MRKLIAALTLFVACLSSANAFEAANIKINLSGPVNDNRYFLCLPNVGCLSVLAAKHGKVYPINHEIDLKGMYVMNVAENFRLDKQALPASCNMPVEKNQTITLTGQITTSSTNETHISQLQCSRS